VMDCVYGSGGAEGWRSIFAQSMDCDDMTDTASVRSRHTGSIWSANGSRKTDERPVSKLRPKKPIVVGTSDSVLTVAQTLAGKRGDAAIILNADGSLAGIITDTDVTRRVVAKDLSARLTNVSDVMTADPTCVSMTDSAMDALVTMVENRFRHLPVTDGNGNIVGCLDIAKCLNDAISKLERAQVKNDSSAHDAVKQVANLQGAGGANQAAALQALLGHLLAHVLGGKSSPSLRSILVGNPSNIVSPNLTLQKVGLMMAESRKAALVVDCDKLVGIFGFKDMMVRAISKELPLDSTPVSAVMTPNPDVVPPETTVLEALQIMHDNKFLTLPVCESDGRVVGLVDVMDCVHASGGSEGWQSLFDSALDEDDSSSVLTNEMSQIRPPVVVASHPNNIPLQVEIGKGLSGDQDSIGESSTLQNPISTVESRAIRSAISDDLVIYKIVDDAGQTYVIRAGKTVDSITEALEGKIANFDPSTAVFKYLDGEGDEILIRSDECLDEAVSSSAQAGNRNVKLSIKSKKRSSVNNTAMLVGGTVLVAAIAIAVTILSKPKK
jgi:CBS domain-containing protein